MVDNDPAVLSATAASLGKWGLTVTCAASLAEARTGLCAAPDVAIMDCRLDGVERGDAVYAALSQHWGTIPPAILLTAENSKETEAAAARMEGRRLLKPAPPAALRALITTALAERRARAVQPRTVSAAG